MVRLLGLSRGESYESPREITTSRTPLKSESGENGWLIRFFDSAFFCEWIAVSYLYKHDHAGVRDYLCNRMYTLPLSGIESYLFQICYMMVHKPSPSLDKFVIDMCSKSLKMAMKVHWFLLAELEDSDDNEGLSRIQEKCQIAATLMGEWPPLVRPPNAGSSPGSKNQVLNRILSSKQRFLSLTSSPPTQLSISSPSGNHLPEDGGNQMSPEENKIFKKFIPGSKVRDAFSFRKSAEKDEQDNEKDGFFKRLLRDSRGGEDEEMTSSTDGFFKRLLRDSKGEEEEMTSSSEGFFKRLFRDSRSDSEDKSVSKPAEDDEKEGFFKKLFKDKFDDKKDMIDRIDDVHMVNSAEKASKSAEDDEKEGFFRKFFKDKFEDKKDGNDKTDDGNANNGLEEKFSKSNEDDEKEGFFRKLFKDKFEDKKDVNDKNDGGEEEESSDFSLFRRLFQVHPEENKTSTANESSNSGGLSESSPGTENFFRKLFRDRDRSIEDSELFSSKKHKEQRPGSPKQQNDSSNAKPPLPNNSASQSRKGAYHESLDFVLSLCETSYGLVDVFPIEDRKAALRESLAEINSHVAEAQNNGGVCFPMGKGLYRVVHIPEDEAVLLNSREKAPFLICVEVLKCELPGTKDASNAQKLSRRGIPLANGDALLPKPPPWAYPLWTAQEVYRNSSDRMSSSTAQAIDQAMTHKSEAKVKLVNVSFSVEKRSVSQSGSIEAPDLQSSICYGNLSAISIQHREDITQEVKAAHASDLEWVRVVLTTDPGLQMGDIDSQEPPHRKEHRRVPSTVAIEEAKAAAAKGEAPPGLPLKGAGLDSSDAQPRANGGMPKAGDTLSGELWGVKKERIRKASAYGKLPGWDLCSVIVKSGDDCRQEHLAVQLISHFYDIFQEAGLPLWLRPYEVLVTSSYTALIETIPDTASLHSIKSRYHNISCLREFFAAKYQENSPSFKLAQRNFVESMAGYSLVCYLLQNLLATVYGNGDQVICQAYGSVNVGVPSSAKLNVQSEQLAVGRETAIYPLFSEGDLFSFYELCKDYKWTIEDEEVLKFGVPLVGSETVQRFSYMDEEELGFINVLHGRTPGSSKVSVSFSCEFISSGSHLEARTYSASISLLVVSDLPLALGAPITWLLPPRYTTSSILPSSTQSYGHKDGQSRKGNIIYSLLRNWEEASEVTQHAVSIDGDRIKTKESNNLACIQAKDRTTGRTEIASCVRVAEVEQIRITNKEFLIHAIDLAVGAEIALSISYFDALGNPFYEASNVILHYAETNYPDVVSVNNTHDSTTIHLKAMRHGRALLRVSIDNRPQKSDYMLISVGAHVHPQNPVLHQGSSIKFSVVGSDDQSSGHWHSANESVIMLHTQSGQAEAVGEGSTQVSFRSSGVKLQTTVTVLPGSTLIVDAPKEMLTNVPFPSQGYSFSVKLSDTDDKINALGSSKGAPYDCRVDPPYVGYAKPWMDLDTGNSYCLFFPYSPEHLVRTIPKLKDMKPYIYISVNASMKEHSHVSGSASALFVGGFSIMRMGKNIVQLNLTSDSNKTIISILGNTEVEIHWRGQDLLTINPIQKEEFGVGGRALYEVKALSTKRFKEKIIVTLPSSGQRAELDVSYEPDETAESKATINVSFRAKVVGSLVLLVITVIIFVCFLDRPLVSRQPSTPPPATTIQAPVTPERSSPLLLKEQSPRTPQPFVDYVRRTIDETPYYRREGRRRFDPQNTY